MKEPEKLHILNEGKTKIIHNVLDDNNVVIIESKEDLTKNDDASQTVQMTGKAKHATATTCRIFEVLKQADIPVAYERQISDTEFLAKKCKMIALESVARRYAVGSALKRYPQLQEKGKLPHRFHRLKVEFFLKTTGGKILNFKDGDVCGQTPIDPEKDRPIEDPFISNPEAEIWVLHHPKYPSWDERAELHCPVFRRNILPENIASIEDIERLTRKVFLVLESAWAQLGIRLIDLKIEFGIGPDGELLVSDVIDNDSWRLRTIDWDELSKQLFRDNADMSVISEKYATVAVLAALLHIPKQAVVFWRGSMEDPFPEVEKNIAGVDIITDTVQSGHKAPIASSKLLEKILSDYPEGGVIIALVGMSNGLGPTLSARTSWPVISVPLTVDRRPHDVWSSLEMPSQVPNATILKVKNAFLYALNILAQKNPAAYLHRQYAIEKLDTDY